MMYTQDKITRALVLYALIMNLINANIYLKKVDLNHTNHEEPLMVKYALVIYVIICNFWRDGETHVEQTSKGMIFVIVTHSGITSVLIWKIG